MASKKPAQKKTGSSRNVTRGGKAKARKGTAPKVARAKKQKTTSEKRSAAGKAGAAARWGKEKRADTTGTE